MAKQLIKKDATSRIEYVWIQDSSSSTGGGLSGLAYNSSGLTAYYVRSQGSATAITLATQTVTGAYSSGGFVEVDATNMKGLYRIDLPNAVFATGANTAVVVLRGATNMAPIVLEYQLVNFDPESSTSLGLSNLDAAITSRLAPTVSGRTLDVSTGGEAGVDWSNVGSPTTTVGLSGTTIKTATDVETDTADIQSRLPAALVGGRMDSSVGAAAANTLTASALAADAVSEIADGVWDEARAGHAGAGTFGEGVASVQGNVTGSTASVTGSVGSLAAQAKTDVNAEVVDALTTDTYAEPASVPAATSSLKDKIAWLFTLTRNKKTQTATTHTLRNDADSASIATSTVSDDGTTHTSGEWT